MEKDMHTEKHAGVDESPLEPTLTVHRGSIDVGNADNLHRRLGNRQIQLLAIGGSIGTALVSSLFVQGAILLSISRFFSAAMYTG